MESGRRSQWPGRPEQTTELERDRRGSLIAEAMRPQLALFGLSAAPFDERGARPIGAVDLRADILG
jgi:hypothetical protein